MQSQQNSGTPAVDVDQMSRSLLLLGGGALALYGFTRRSWPGLLLAGLGGSVVARCYQGGCEGALGEMFCEREVDPVVHSNHVDEASWESFPASDAPARHQITS